MRSIQDFSQQFSHQIPDSPGAACRDRGVLYLMRGAPIYEEKSRRAASSGTAALLRMEIGIERGATDGI